MAIGIGVFAVLAISAVAWFSPLMNGRREYRNHFIGATVLAAWSVGAGAKIYVDSLSEAPSTLVAEAMRVGSSAWPDGVVAARDAPVRPAPAAPAPAASVPESSAVTSAAPIHSLIGGLEARLERDPGDVKGWALLAQSYAFLGDLDGAERATRRAVELGMDEAALRERVQKATRQATSQNWIESAIGG